MRFCLTQIIALQLDLGFVFIDPLEDGVNFTLNIIQAFCILPPVLFDQLEGP